MPYQICSYCNRLSPKSIHDHCRKLRQAQQNAKKESAYDRGYNTDYYRARSYLLHDPNARCAECGSLGPLEVDHITPLSKGGTNDMENLQVLCRFHNRSKGGR